MKIKVTITGTIDVPDSWADGNCGELRTAEYRYNDQLTAEDALGELAEKLAKHPDDLTVNLLSTKIFSSAASSLHSFRAVIR